jgi:3-oxo-5,6-didehydrosuberyl-CoA/3-oxoadipyl-CoA thiolase
MTDAFIIDGVRSAIGRYGGALGQTRGDDLASIVIRRLIERHPALDAELIDDVYLGCSNQAGEDNRNVARMALLLAGLPKSVPGVTVNRLCASGMSAVVEAGRAIQTEDGRLYIAGGLEHMTRAPYVMAKPSEGFSRAPQIFDTTLGWRFVNPRIRDLYGIDSMGETAEHVADKYTVAREDQDRFALWSHQKAAQATRSGRLAMEIVSLQIQQGKGPAADFKEDECIRFDTSLEKLSKLAPAFRKDKSASVTAGNSSGINDGACALMIASAGFAKANDLKPMARIVSSAVAGVEPRLMGTGPIPATKKALARAGLKLDEMDVIEINEAFAVQVLACMREFGLSDNDPRVNPNGGAIALGHPLGMSGARLLLTAAYELQRRNLRYALCTMCVGVGQGMTTIIERA